MQLELIAPANEDSTFLPRLAMGILAAMMSPEDEVIYSDDLIRPFNIERDLKDVDLVGISIDSKTARRSYDIAWKKFYSADAIWQRWTVRRPSSWIQTLGYFPLNIMQNRLVKRKIVGGVQRFRTSLPLDACAS